MTLKSPAPIFRWAEVMLKKLFVHGSTSSNSQNRFLIGGACSTCGCLLRSSHASEYGVSLLGAFTVCWLGAARLRMLQNWLTGPWPVTWLQTRGARAGLEDALGIEQRHAVLVGLGAERQAGVVVGRGVGGRGRRVGDSAAQASATPAASRRSRGMSRFMTEESRKEA